MSNRLHSKYHRHNHHTFAENDARFPDAGHDPIASYDSPFMGDFVMLGTLSATAIPAYSDAGSTAAGVFQSEDTALQAIAPLTGIAVKADGNVLISGDLSASNLFLTGVPEIDPSQITTSGNFLVITVNNVQKAIRLWDLP